MRPLIVSGGFPAHGLSQGVEREAAVVQERQAELARERLRSELLRFDLTRQARCGAPCDRCATRTPRVDAHRRWQINQLASAKTLVLHTYDTLPSALGPRGRSSCL
jgi:hypothetical protein